MEVVVPEMGDFVSSGRLSLRSNLATQHLRVAVRDAQSAHAVEQANDTTQLGEWFDDIMMYVPVAVVMAAAALEANSNEIIKDILDKSKNVQLSGTQTMRLMDLKEDRSGGALEKYRKLAAILGKTPVVGSVAWGNAKLLFLFRNRFMHFKPAWDNETDVHDGELVKGLKKVIPISPVYQSGFMFPYGFLTYGCAKWAVESAVKFSAEFATLIGVGDRFAGGSNLP
jgi:hypothetical protein